MHIATDDLVSRLDDLNMVDGGSLPSLTWNVFYERDDY